MRTHTEWQDGWAELGFEEMQHGFDAGQLFCYELSGGSLHAWRCYERLRV